MRKHNIELNIGSQTTRGDIQVSEKDIIGLLRGKLNDLRNMILDRDQKIDLLQKSLKTLNKYITEDRAQIGQIDDIKARERLAINRATTLASEVEQLKQQIQQQTERADLSQQFDNLKKKYKQVKQLNAQNQNNYGKMIQDYEKKLQYFTNMNESLQRKLNKILFQRKNVEKEAENQKKENADLRNQLMKLQKLKETSENLLRKHNSDLQKQIDNFSSQNNKEDDIQKMQLKELQEQNQIYSSELGNIQMQIGNCQQIIQQKDLLIKQLNQQIDDMTNAQNPQTIEILQKDQEISQLKQQIKLIEEQLEKSQNLKESYKKDCQSAYTKAIQLEKSREAERELFKKDISVLQSQHQQQIKGIHDEYKIQLEQNAEKIQKLRVQNQHTDRKFKQEANQNQNIKKALQNLQQSIEIIYNSLLCISCMEPLQPAMIIITCGHVICTNCDNTKCPECGEYSEGVVQCSHYNLLIGKVNYAKMAIEELNNFIKD